MQLGNHTSSGSIARYPNNSNSVPWAWRWEKENLGLCVRGCTPQKQSVRSMLLWFASSRKGLKEREEVQAPKTRESWVGWENTPTPHMNCFLQHFLSKDSHTQSNKNVCVFCQTRKTTTMVDCEIPPFFWVCINYEKTYLPFRVCWHGWINRYHAVIHSEKWNGCIPGRQEFKTLFNQIITLWDFGSDLCSDTWPMQQLTVSQIASA